MQRKTHTIGLRADTITITLLNDASQIFNISKSEVLRNALASTYGASVLGYKSNLMESYPPLN